MKLIALTGAIASGKTAVAKELAARGYLLISYTDALKVLVAQALTSVGVETSLADILARKEFYRPLIQEFGTVIGYDSGAGYMEAALEGWRETGQPAAVIDNVRTDGQAWAAQKAGFNVVRLVASQRTRRLRLALDGKDPAAVLARETHHIESGIVDELVDLQVDANYASPDLIAAYLATAQEVNYA